MLINLRNALMAGKRLPYDAEVEFLESTGTQWIDTGYIPTSTSGAQVVGEFISLPTSDYSGFFGCKTTGVSDRFWAVSSNQNNGTLVGFGNNYTMASASLNTIYTTQVNYKNSRTATFTSTTNVSGFNNGGTRPLFLFAVNIGGQAYYQGSMRIYSAQLTESSEIVRDYIPVRVGTVGYLYDRVSGKLFGNAGTGDFVVGQDVVPVEYIESHGTEYINTGIILNDTYGIDINFAPMGTASGVSEHGIFGSSVSGSGIRHNVLQIHSSAGGVGLWMPSNTRICNYAITVGEYQHWQINLNDSDDVVVDNVLKGHTHPTTPAECQYPVYLFGRDVANTLKSGSCSKMRLATWMVCDGSGNFIQKWLPVRVGTEGAMMDVLTRRIYRNAGTGAFTYGNDLKYPIPAS